MARGKKVQIKELPLNKIKLGRNSRLDLRDEDVSGLMQSINSQGLLEPIGVVESKCGKFWEVAYGNKRFIAFSKLGLHSIPCVIHKRKHDHDVDIMNLAENVQRRNISLAEVGRYATILEGEGLNIKELAVRLGAPVNYVETCIKAYREVPEEFRPDLEMQVTGKQASPGKISIHKAKAILNAKKAHGLNAKETKFLFKAAKDDARFNPDDVAKYSAAMKRDVKDPIGSVKATKTLTFRFIMDEDEYDKLYLKYVANGPFNGFAELVRAVCRGQKAIPINFIR